MRFLDKKIITGYDSSVLIEQYTDMKIKNLWIFNEKRLLLLKVLLDCEEDLCGCDLIEELDINKTLLNYHINILKKNGYLEEEKCGRKKIYKIKDSKRDKVQKILKVIEFK